MPSCPWTHFFECLDSYRSHYFGVSLKIKCPSLFLSLPPFFPPSSPRHPQWNLGTLQVLRFSQRSQNQPLSPGRRGPVLSPGQVSADIATPPPLLVFLTNRNPFLLPPKLGRLQKFLTSLEKKNERQLLTQKSPQKLQQRQGWWSSNRPSSCMWLEGWLNNSTHPGCMANINILKLNTKETDDLLTPGNRPARLQVSTTPCPGTFSSSKWTTKIIHV